MKTYYVVGKVMLSRHVELEIKATSAKEARSIAFGEFTKEAERQFNRLCNDEEIKSYEVIGVVAEEA